MVRLILAALMLVGSTAWAQKPAVAEGVVVRLEGGFTQWSLEPARVQGQEGVPEGDVQPAFADQVQAGPTATLELGYNIAGHVTLAASVAATGWDLSTRDRGGGGFVAGLIAWHPLELIPSARDRSWDLSFFGGAGYGVVGEVRAMDGLHAQFGGRAEYFPTPWLSVGLSVRTVPLMFRRYVIDWNNEVSVPLRDSSGGSVLIPSLGLTIHAPVGATR